MFVNLLFFRNFPNISIQILIARYAHFVEIRILRGIAKNSSSIPPSKFLFLQMKVIRQLNTWLRHHVVKTTISTGFIENMAIWLYGSQLNGWEPKFLVFLIADILFKDFDFKPISFKTLYKCFINWTFK